MSLQEPQETLRKHLQNQGKLEQLTILKGLQWLDRSQGQQAELERAENEWYMQQMGQEPKPSGDDAMGNTILGDITQPPAIVVASQQQSNLWPALAIGLATLLPIAGVGAAGAGAAAAYLLSRPPATEPRPDPEFEDSSVSIGLSRIDDFLIEDE